MQSRLWPSGAPPFCNMERLDCVAFRGLGSDRQPMVIKSVSSEAWIQIVALTSTDQVTLGSVLEEIPDMTWLSVSTPSRHP